MDKIFFSDWQSIIRILIISVAAYFSLILILRISGKRTLSKMNAFDFIITVALGSTLSAAILNKNVTLAEGVLAFIVLVGLQFLITYLSIEKKFISNLMKSTPTLMLYKGEFLKKNMKKERILEDEVLATLRENGIGSVEEADAVVLETDGTLTVIKDISDPTTSVIKNVRKEYDD